MDPGDSLFNRLPGATAAGPPVTAFPTTEQRMLRHNVERPGSTLTAAYPSEAPTWMDYPFAVLATANPAERDAAARLLVALQEPEGQAALTAGGFRTADGQVPADRLVDARIVRQLPAPVPLVESPTSDAALQRWAAATRSGRIEVLIDVSGSMNAVVPKLRKTRLAVTLDAAARGLNLFEPTTTLGLWTFANRLDGERDYRQVMPVTPVPQLLSGPGLEALRSIRAVPGAHTGLYDSVLGLYEEARRTGSRASSTSWSCSPTATTMIPSASAARSCCAVSPPTPTRPGPCRSSGWRSALTSNRARWRRSRGPPAGARSSSPTRLASATSSSPRWAR